MPLTRLEVPEERKWDLSSLFASPADAEKEYEAINVKLAEISAFKGKLDRSNVIECLKLKSEIFRRAENVFVYANLIKDSDTAEPEAQAAAEKASNLMTGCMNAVFFVEPEIRSTFSPAEMAKLGAENPDFDMYFKDLKKSLGHILPAGQEKILAEISNFAGDFKNAFMLLDNADLTFNPVRKGGKSVELNHGNYSNFLQDASQDVRRRAFENYYASYKAHINTIAALYAASVKKDVSVAKIRKYKSAMNKALDSENVSAKVYDNLIAAVHKKLPFLHSYIRYRLRSLGVDELHMYDLYVPLTAEYKLELEYDDAFDLVKEALSVLGDDYVALLDRAKSERWIDVEATRNKRSGAYSWGTYDSNPFVLLNYTKTSHDVFTIAHELGHSMHSHYSRSSQCYEKADYTIFLAEIASTVNEVLLLKHLMRGADGEKKRYLLNYYLDMFRTTLFRQTMFAEFEEYAHAEAEKGMPLTAKSLSDEYYRLNRVYYGRDVVHDEQIALEWARIPHFYTAFYVYKYATGLTVAVNVASRILAGEEGFVEKYKKFLSAGGSDYPLNILSELGIDLEKKAPFLAALDEFTAALEELKSL